MFSSCMLISFLTSFSIISIKNISYFTMVLKLYSLSNDGLFCLLHFISSIIISSLLYNLKRLICKVSIFSFSLTTQASHQMHVSKPLLSKDEFIVLLWRLTRICSWPREQKPTSSNKIKETFTTPLDKSIRR